MVELICAVCKENFSLSEGQHRKKIKRGQQHENICCSNKCAGALRTIRTKVVHLTCPCCNKSFTQSMSRYNQRMKAGIKENDLCCSPKCRDKHRSNTHTSIQNFVELECKNCSKIFTRHKSEIKRNLERKNKNNYCSISCKAQDQTKSLFFSYVSICRGRSKQYKFTEMDLDTEYIEALWLKQKGKCALTNIPIHLYGGSQATRKKFLLKLDCASLDRIDNKIGYMKGNVQFVAMGANYAKSRYTDEDVMKFFAMVVENFHTRP